MQSKILSAAPKTIVKRGFGRFLRQIENQPLPKTFTVPQKEQTAKTQKVIRFFFQKRKTFCDVMQKSPAKGIGRAFKEM
ncbi:MAG: hypothetical protein ACI39G_06815 [Pseudoramibacter sp.]